MFARIVTWRTALETARIIVVMIEESLSPRHADIRFYDCMTCVAFGAVLGVVIEAGACIWNYARRLIGRVATGASSEAVVRDRSSGPSFANICRRGQMAARALALSAGGMAERRRADINFRPFVHVASHTCRGIGSKVRMKYAQCGACRVNSVSHAGLVNPRCPLTRHRRCCMALCTVWHSGKGVRHLILNYILNRDVLSVAGVTRHTCGGCRRVTELSLLPGFTDIRRLIVALDAITGAARVRVVIESRIRADRTFGPLRGRMAVNAHRKIARVIENASRPRNTNIVSNGRVASYAVACTGA